MTWDSQAEGLKDEDSKPKHPPVSEKKNNTMQWKYNNNNNNNTRLRTPTHNNPHQGSLLKSYRILKEKNDFSNI